MNLYTEEAIELAVTGVDIRDKPEYLLANEPSSLEEEAKLESPVKAETESEFPEIDLDDILDQNIDAIAEKSGLVSMEALANDEKFEHAV